MWLDKNSCHVVWYNGMGFEEMKSDAILCNVMACYECDELWWNVICFDVMWCKYCNVMWCDVM